MTPPAFSPAQKAATLIENQIIGLQTQIQAQVTRLNGLLANGIPAQGASPAVTAADLATAMGSNLATVQEILAALAAAVPSA